MSLRAVAFPPLALPINYPRHPGFGYAGSCRSALEVGGDLCDLLFLTENSLLLVVADVMGKGLPAALFATSLRSLIRSLAFNIADPGKGFTELNQFMFDQLSSADTFITAQMAVADLDRRRLLVANAGHCPLLLSDGSGKTRTIAPDGIPLGIQRTAAYPTECVVLKPFASTLLYTDGVTEARDPPGNLFGRRRLEEWFANAVGSHQTAIQMKRGLLRELSSFQGGDQPLDDQTFLILSDEAPRPVPSEETPSLMPVRTGCHSTPAIQPFIVER